MRKGGTWRAWTKGDDAQLRRLYPGQPTNLVAAALGRSVGTVYVRASHLGIVKLTKDDKQRAASAAEERRGGWKKKDLALLRKLYPTTTGRDIAEILGIRTSRVHAKANKLGLKKAPGFMASVARAAMNDPKHGARQHQFKKGREPLNKGMKGWQAGGRSVLTQFKPGRRPTTAKPLCSVSEMDGYLTIKINDEGYAPIDWKPIHRLLWEWKNGPIPPKHCVIFDDGNRRNFSDENLKLISMADNARRNSIHNLPAELKDTIMQLGRLKRRIRSEEQDRRSA